MQNTTDNIFLKRISNANRVVALDFDGVIHNDYKGFHDGTVYGEPFPGAIDAIKKLSTRYQIVIYTCKANPDRPLVDGKTGIQLVKEWLESYGILSYISDVVWGKPNAFVYVDDKGYRFENWEDTLNFLK